VILGVRLPASEWLQMTGLILVGLVPFAALGIFLGQKLTVDAVGPFIGGGTALLALLSGTWFPLPQTGFLHDVAQYLPSSWLVSANRVALGGTSWAAAAGSWSQPGASCSSHWPHTPIARTRDGPSPLIDNVMKIRARRVSH
jgi:ABC-type multidrug transport system permease subunit